MGKTIEYLKFKWKVTTFVFISYLILLGVIVMQFIIISSILCEFNCKVKQVFELEKQIIGLKLSHPTETSSLRENYWWEDEPEKDYFR